MAKRPSRHEIESITAQLDALEAAIEAKLHPERGSRATELRFVDAVTGAVLPKYDRGPMEAAFRIIIMSIPTGFFLPTLADLRDGEIAKTVEYEPGRAVDLPILHQHDAPDDPGEIEVVEEPRAPSSAEQRRAEESPVMARLLERMEHEKANPKPAPSEFPIRITEVPATSSISANQPVVFANPPAGGETARPDPKG